MLRHGNLLANLEQVRSAGGDRPGPTTSCSACCRCSTSSAERRARPHAAGRCQRRARRALRPGHRARHDPGPRGHDRPRRAADVGRRGRRCRRSRWRRFARRPPRHCPARPSCPSTCAGALKERFGVELREGYGLTEASPVVTTSTGIEPRTGSIGQVVAGVEVRLVDADGDDVLVGDPGEIWVRGPNVFQGYWNDPEATARALTARRLAAHRRHRRRRRRRLPLPRRPGQGPHHRVGLQRVPGRGRGGPRSSARRGRGGGGRRAPPAHRRGGQGLRRARAGRPPRRGGRDQPLPATTWPATSARPR